jgi:hypothetical protein
VLAAVRELLAERKVEETSRSVEEVPA